MTAETEPGGKLIFVEATPLVAYRSVSEIVSLLVPVAKLAQDALEPEASPIFTITFLSTTGVLPAVQPESVVATFTFFCGAVPVGVSGGTNVMVPETPVQLTVPEATPLRWWDEAHADELNERPTTVPKGIAQATRTNANFR